MQVFLSWSLPRSKAVATALFELLPTILQPINCWMSEAGLEKGRPWFDTLSKTLDQIVFGLFCVTPENKNSVWMNWEAGFLSSTGKLGERHVAPLAIGMQKGELGGPYAIYQATDSSSREDMLMLVKSINKSLPEGKSIAEATLEGTFEFIWPKLQERLEAARAMPTDTPAPAPPSRQDELADILAMLRQFQRENADIKDMVQALSNAASLGGLGRPVLVPNGSGGGGYVVQSSVAGGSTPAQLLPSEVYAQELLRQIAKPQGIPDGVARTIKEWIATNTSPTPKAAPAVRNPKAAPAVRSPKEPR